MKKSLIAIFGLFIMMMGTVAGYSNSRDGTTIKIGNVYDVSVNETMPVDIQVADVTILSDITAISETVKIVKEKKHDCLVAMPPGLPDTYFAKIPYGKYAIKNYITFLSPPKNRYRRDQALTLTYEKTSSGPLGVPTIRKLLC